MPINTNTWNRIRYSVYTPIYDLIAGAFSTSRRRAVDKLDIKPGDRVLIIGGGTGLDLPHFPEDVLITGVDITPGMVKRFNDRAQALNVEAGASVMDAQDLEFEDGAFDIVLLHLILAVIPDPIKCIQEAERVIKPGGQISVFDKFVPPGERPGLLRNLINPVINLLATNINRSFEDIVEQSKLEVLVDEPADLAGFFRIIKVQKPETNSS